MNDTITTKMRIHGVWFLLPEEDLGLSVDRPGPAAGSSPCSVFRFEDALCNLKSLKPTGVREAQTPWDHRGHNLLHTGTAAVAQN